MVWFIRLASTNGEVTHIFDHLRHVEPGEVPILIAHPTYYLVSNNLDILWVTFKDFSDIDLSDSL